MSAKSDNPSPRLIVFGSTMLLQPGKIARTLNRRSGFGIMEYGGLAPDWQKLAPRLVAGEIVVWTPKPPELPPGFPEREEVPQVPGAHGVFVGPPDFTGRVELSPELTGFIGLDWTEGDPIPQIHTNMSVAEIRRNGQTRGHVVFNRESSSVAGFPSGTDNWHWTAAQWPSSFSLKIPVNGGTAPSGSYQSWSDQPMTARSSAPPSPGGSTKRYQLRTAGTWRDVWLDVAPGSTPSQRWFAHDSELDSNDRVPLDAGVVHQFLTPNASPPSSNMNTVNLGSATSITAS